MKKIIFFALILLKIFPLLAQSNLQIVEFDSVSGKNFVTNNTIKAKVYVFPERIHQLFIDTTRNLLTIQLRGMSRNGKHFNNFGSVLVYDLGNKSTKWSKRINYDEFSIEQYDNVIIKSVVYESNCLNPETGRNQWLLKNTLYYVDPHHQIGLGYKDITTPGKSNILEGLDMTNGNKLWSRTLSREYGWNTIIPLNDSVVLVVSAGLHTINLKTGTGWDYNTVTGINNSSGQLAANALGLAAGLLTGYFMYSTSPSIVRDMASNVIYSDNGFYFASRESITHLDKNGVVRWSYPFPKNLSSSSFIFIKNDFLYMINKGYAFMGSEQVAAGKPFIAVFDLHTGKNLFLDKIVDLNHINGYKVQDDEVFILSDHVIVKISLENGLQISKKAIDSEMVSELSNFADDRTYDIVDSAYTKVVSDKRWNYIITKSGEVIVVNNSLEIATQFDSGELYDNYLTMNGYRFLARGNATVVIDDSNTRIAEMKASANAILKGTILYDFQGNRFIKIDLSELLNRKQ